MYLFGYVDKKNEKTTGIKIPGGLSFLVHQDFSTPVKGLKSFKPEDRPNSPNTVFQTYHLMISIGMFFIALSIYAGILLWRDKLFEKKWLMYIFLWGVLLPQLA